MMHKAVFAAAFACLISGVVAAQALAAVVNPLTLIIGTPVHLTPVDQGGTAIPIAQCTLSILSSVDASVTKDATGFVITALRPFSNPNMTVSCKDVWGSPAVVSPVFTVTAPVPVYPVTAVGTTSP